MSNDPKAWRETLYSNYSAHTAAARSITDSSSADPGISPYAQYGQTYGTSLSSAPDGPVLDLGCAAGDWLLWMKQNGRPIVCGVDLNGEDLKAAASRGIEVHQAHVTDFLRPFENHFAIIHAKDLIEHLDKNELVELGLACLKALKPGGLFVMSTYNAQAPLAATTRYGDFTHESGFTRVSISQWLYACGFSSVSAWGYHVSPGSLKGRFRKICYSVVAKVCEFIVTLRHGKDSTTSCLPDLLAVAVKKPSP